MHWEGPVPSATLHLLTGPWASGKTTLVPHLARLLPDVVVFDWDVLLPGLSAAAEKDAHTDPSTWEGLRRMWLAIVGSVLAGGRDVLLCGPLGKGDIADPGILAFPIRCAFLDCGDEALAERLRTRGVTESELEEELSELATLRGSPCEAIRASGSPEQTAAAVVTWVRAAH